MPEGFSHKLTPYKIVGHFSGRSYLDLALANKVENSFLINFKKLLTFFRPCREIALIHRHVSDKKNTAIHGYENDTTGAM